MTGTRKAVEWRRAFDDAHAENVELYAEARKRDKKVAEVLDLVHGVCLRASMQQTERAKLLQAFAILQELDA